MTIDARIPMMGQPSNGLASFMQGQEDNKRNQLLDLQIQNQQSQADKGSAEAEMAQLKSQFMPIVTTASRIKALGGATPENLQQINSLIAQSGANPESVQQSVALLQAGDFQGFNNELDNVLAAGRQMGLVNEAKDQSFTLSEGQTRFDPQGNVIAENPKAENLKGGSTINLSVHMQKRLSAANDAAIEASSNAIEFEELATQIASSNIRGGLFGATWTEKAKELTGNQDAVSALRKRYFAIRSSAAVKNLPPGVASDKDIEMALMGFPSEKANKEEISSFLRGLAKLERAADQYNTFTANYISTTGGEKGMLSAWRDSAKPKSNERQNIPEGFVLMEDTSGKRAYVNQTTGEIREVQ